MQARKNLPIECARRPTCSSEQTFRRLDKDPLVRPTELFFDINCNKYWLGFYRILQQLPLVSPHISQHCAVEITCNVRSCQSLCLFTRQSVTMSLVFQYQKGVFQVTQTYPSLNPSGAFPFERSTCVLSAFALYLLIDHSRNRPPYPTPLHSLGGCNVVWLVSWLFSYAVASIG